MNIIYKSQRIGKNGKQFYMYKFKTLKDGSDKESHFASDQQYTRFGKFLRKYKIDELPQLWNILKGDMAVVGPRPEEPMSMSVLPKELRDIILSIKPGLTSFSSLYFYDEEEILKITKQPARDYWLKIKPVKLALDIFYINHKCFFLNCVIIWITIKKLIGRFFSNVVVK